MPAPPADLRYLKIRKHDQSRSLEVTADVMEFLRKIYCSVAETLPDVKDGTLSDDDMEDESVFKLVATQPLESEPYADFNTLRLKVEATMEPLPSSGKRAKPRKMRKSIPIREGRTTAEFEERYLPPGTMQEYFVQYVRQSALEQPASFPSFWRAPSL